MRYAVLDRGDPLSRQLSEQLQSLAADKGLTYDVEKPEIVVSIGGDGTLLQAFHRYKDQLSKVSFVGIHTGHLGFYTDWKKEEVPVLVEMMATSEPHNVVYPLLQIEVNAHAGRTTYLALNEFTLKGVDGTLVAALRVNNEPFEMFRGDGIVISTPTGSTGYNKSLGGAVIHPSLEALQIAEIASINNRVYRTLGSSVILPKHHHCDIVPDPNKPLQYAVDHLTVQMSGITTITCRVSDQKVQFARYRPYPFWNRVRESFIGLDV